MAIPSAKKSKSKPSFPDHTTSYSYFYRYAGFILFAKEVNHEMYKDIQELYLSPASRSYKEDFQSYVSQWKSLGRKATADDLEFIFSMVKEPQSTVSAVRSATIKRTGTVAKTLRTPLIEGIGRSEKDRERNEQEGRLPVGQIFDEILSAVVNAIVQEQSFAMEFLHLSPAASSGKGSYEDFITTGNKGGWKKSIDTKRAVESNKNAARDTVHVMEQLLFWLPEELSSIIEWCKSSDALYIVS
jgi:exocyst complex component 1